MNNDVIIVGAGAAGLMAMHELVSAGYKVCVLEASAQAGGRIRTLDEKGFDLPVEAGAEFVHGNLPLTLRLLKEAGILVTPVGGQMITVNEPEKEQAHDVYWGEFMQELSKLREDKPLLEILNDKFPADQYASLRKSVQKFAEGFDLADISRASSLFLQKEWSHENEQQYRVQGCYIKLVHHLLQKSLGHLASLHLNAIVSRIEHSKGRVILHCTDGRAFEAKAAIITVSAGVLQLRHIEFMPAIPGQATAFDQLGFGAVIKMLLQFKTAFWSKQYPDLGFLLSDEKIPTWWTQSSPSNCLLTGWLGGPTAHKMASRSDAELLNSSLESLSNIFKISSEILRRELVHHHIASWCNDPFIEGGYSYPVVGSAEIKQFLSQPVNETIFFAGEALHEGESQGTVEAALQNGRDAATKLIKILNR